jgi:hypothetical protein
MFPDIVFKIIHEIFKIFQIVTKCCAIKPLSAWNLGETASVCRERCGGQVSKIFFMFDDYSKQKKY